MTTTQTADVWHSGEQTDLRGIPVHINDRMTDDELRRDLERAETLLDELDGYPVDRIVAYGSLGRIGVGVETGHDPLMNGIITSNVDGFRVDAVRPSRLETVFIRFQDTDVVDE